MRKELGTSATMRHFYSNEWCRDDKARTQEELQAIAQKIRRGCKVEERDNFNGGEFGTYTCTIYINENLGLRYWVKDEFGWITEIDEARYN